MEPEEYLSQIESLPKQILDGYELGATVKLSGKFDRIVIGGMGGSGIPGKLLKSYIGNKIPVEVIPDYTLPEYYNSKTLYFAISYSGNTEESIEAAKDAHRQGCKIVALTTGGKLRKQAEKNNWHLILVPSGMQPRAGLPYLFFALIRVLENAKILKNAKAQVKRTSEAMKNPALAKQAEKLADQLEGKIPLIYASERLSSVAYRWQTQLNENAKIHAFHHSFPELNHNQMVGFTKLNGDYHVIILEDQGDHRRIKKRMAISRKLIKKAGVGSTLIDFTDVSPLVRMFSMIHIGDLTSFFLSEHYGIDPVQVAIVENLKKDMGPYA